MRVLNRDVRHLDANDVADLLARSLSGDRGSRVVGHLVNGCEPCRVRVREALLRASQPRDDEAAYFEAFDRAFDAVLARSAALVGRELAELDEGARLWPALRDQPPGRRLTMVLNSRKYRTAGVLAALSQDYQEGLWREPREGLAIAELGVAIAEGLDAVRYRPTRLADLQGAALAMAGNARRLAACPAEAGQLLRQAARRLEEGSGDLLLAGQLQVYQGGHWQTLRHFDKAARAFGRAEQLYRWIGDHHLAARALVARAEAVGHQRPGRGVLLVRRAIPDIDGERDPHLEMAAHHGLAWYLNDAGRGWEARQEVERSASLYHRFSGDAVASLSRAWLAGRIDRSLRELDQARRWYERAWAGFEELGMEVHQTLLAIDRAELQAAAGEWGGAAARLGATRELVQSWGVNQETLAVLRQLHEAVLARRCGRGAFRQASLALRRCWAKAEEREEAGCG